MLLKIIRIALATAGILSLANVILLLRVSNPTAGFLVQGILSAVLICYAIFFNKIPNVVHIMSAAMVFVFVSFMVFLFSYGNTSNADGTEEVVIVLGAGVTEDRISRPLARRLDQALYFWRENPNATIVVTGGLGSRAIITEAEAMFLYLAARGVPSANILLEDQSTSTYENLKFANELFALLDRPTVIITNDFHLFRAVQTARRVGFEDVRRIGAHTTWYSVPVNYLREVLAVLNFWVRR